LEKICLNRLRNYLRRSTERRSRSSSFGRSRRLLTKSPKVKVRRFGEGDGIFLLAIIVLISLN